MVKPPTEKPPAAADAPPAASLAPMAPAALIETPKPAPLPPVHAADDLLRSAMAPVLTSDEYGQISQPPSGTLLKADSTKLSLHADTEGRVRLTCGSWEDARVLLPGQALGLRREGTYWVIFRIEGAK